MNPAVVNCLAFSGTNGLERRDENARTRQVPVPTYPPPRKLKPC
jgi:hypothetical protein